MSGLAIYTGTAFTADNGRVEVAPLASIEVRREDTGALASLFSDRAGTAGKANPFTADNKGRFSFNVVGRDQGYRVIGRAAGSPSEEVILRYQAIGTLAELDNPLTTAGDLFFGGAAGVPARLPIGAAGTIPIVRAGTLAYLAGLTKQIYGLTYANGNGAGGGDLTNDITIFAGGAMDATGAYFMPGSQLTKQLDAAWAVGSAAGGLDTGSIGNSDYHIWMIARSDTGVVDYLFSLSSTAPTMPANYDFKRLIGWFKRVGGTIVAFTTYETEGGGIELAWTTPTLDVNLANTLTTTRRTDAVKGPLTFSTIAHLRAGVYDATTAFDAIVCCPDETDTAPSSVSAPGISFPQGTNRNWMEKRIRTSSAGLIAARAGLATVDLYTVITLGFNWARRN